MAGQYGTGRIDPNALNQNIKSWSGPVAAPKAAPKAPPPAAGPTGFWGRIGQIGIGKVNAINAYRKVAHSGPTVDSNNSPVKTAGRGIKAFGKGAVAGEQTTANVLARLVPGGQKDIEQQNKNIDTTNRDRATIMTIKNPQVRAKLLKSSGEGNAQAIEATRKSIPTRGQAVAGVASTALDAVSGGGGSLALKEGAKFTAEKGAAKLATGKLVTKVPEALQAGKKTQAAVIAGTSAAAGATNAKASGAKGKDIAIQAGAGAAIPLFGAGVSKVFEMGPKAALSKVRSVISRTPETPTASKGAMEDVMTGSQADKVAAAAHTKINVADTGAKSGENVAVRTPLRPGVKEVSTTDKINVRTPVKMTDEQFHQEFNKLSKSYDQEHAALQKDVAQNPKPTTQQAKIAKAAKNQDTIDGYHHSSELVKDHADMMRQIDETAKGGQKQRTADGGYVRTSEHTPFYRQYFKENGRAPSQAAYKEQAQKELESGKAPYGMSDTHKSLKARETGSGEPVVVPVGDGEGASGKLSTRQVVAARAIDTKYEKAMNDLIDRYHTSALSEPVAPKTIARKTTPAGRSTGGARTARSGKLVARTERSPEATAVATAKERSMPPELKTRPDVPSGTRLTSGSALKSEARAVEAGVTKELADKATYSAGGYKEEAEKAVKLLDDNSDRARSIAFGHTPGDNTIHEVAVRRAVENRAVKEGDVDTLRILANSNQHTVTSEAGQRLGAEGYNTVHNSPVDHMKSVAQAREKSLSSRGQTVDKAAAQTAKEIKSQIHVPTKDEWHMFVESIKC